MILKEFSQYLQENLETSAVVLLNTWLKEKIENPALSNIDKIIQAELSIAKNKLNDTLIVAKSESGRKLTTSLYNFSLSFEQQKLARWLHKKNASDFKNPKTID